MRAETDASRGARFALGKRYRNFVGDHVFAKILAIILGCSIIGAMLLVNRQRQIEAEHGMTVIHRRLVDQDRTIWRLRAEIAQQCSPDALHRLKAGLDEGWKPIIIDLPEAQGRERLIEASFGRTLEHLGG